MTEKEVFINMIHRVVAGAGRELSDYYCENDDNSVTIINASLEKTLFYFDENGALIFYE
jgi:hypothetical protein